MNPNLIQDAFSKIDDQYIVESHPETVIARNGRPAKAPGLWSRFASSGIGAAVISGVVALGVLAAIIAAGQMDPADSPAGGPTPGAPGYAATGDGDSNSYDPSLTEDITFMTYPAPMEPSPDLTVSSDSHLILSQKGIHDVDLSMGLSRPYMIYESVSRVDENGEMTGYDADGEGALAQIDRLAPELEKTPMIIRLKNGGDLVIEANLSGCTITRLTAVNAYSMQEVFGMDGDGPLTRVSVPVNELAEANGDDMLFLVIEVARNTDEVTGAYEYAVCLFFSNEAIDPEETTEDETVIEGDSEAITTYDAEETVPSYPDEHETLPPAGYVEVPELENPIFIADGFEVVEAQVITYGKASEVRREIRLCQLTVPENGEYATSDAVYLDIYDLETDESTDRMLFFGHTTVVADEGGDGNRWSIINIAPVYTETGKIELQIQQVQIDIGDISGEGLWEFYETGSSPTRVLNVKTLESQFKRLYMRFYDDFGEMSDPVTLLSTDRYFRKSDLDPLPSGYDMVDTWQNVDCKDLWAVYAG